MTIATDDPGTRQTLIRAGLDLFGRHGFEASSIRQIARAARANSAGIAYHFGGKDGLRLACAEAVVAMMKERVFGAAAHGPVALPPASPEAAEGMLLAIVARVTAFAAQAPESETVARFVVREMMEPSAAFEILYDGLVGPVHGQLCRLWATATGASADSDETRLSVFTMIGQVLYFRLGRPAVIRRMGWSTIGEGEGAAISAVIAANVQASIANARRRRP